MDYGRSGGTMQGQKRGRRDEPAMQPTGSDDRRRNTAVIIDFLWNFIIFEEIFFPSILPYMEGSANFRRNNAENEK